MNVKEYVNHGNPQLFPGNKGSYSVVACVQESLEKSSSIVEMSSILLSLPFFLWGQFSLRNLRTGQQKRMCFGAAFLTFFIATRQKN